MNGFLRGTSDVGRGTWVMIGSAAALLAACSDQPLDSAIAGPRAAVVAVSGSQADALPRTVRPEEQAFADLALKAPSSAGFFVDELGTPIVMVRDDRDRGVAISAFDEGQARFSAQLRLKSARYQRADYSFGQLARWRDLLFDGVFNSVPGVSSLDLDEKQNRVTLGLAAKSFAVARASVEKSMDTLGIERAAVLFTVEEPSKFMSGSATSPTSNQLPPALTDYFTDVIGGIQISSSLAASGLSDAPCSVGFTALYAPVSGAPYPAFVTATHCTAVWGALDGTTFRQPGSGTPIMAVETRDPNKYGCFGNWCRASDAALAQIDGARGYQIGLIARTTFASVATPNVSGSVTIDQMSPFFMISQTANVPVGTIYHKMGWKTGWTSGTKIMSCTDHHYDHPNRVGWFDYYVTKCVDAGTAWTDGGDSGGSVFVRLDSNKVALLGTTVGRSGSSGTGAHIFSPFSRIASDMGGTLNVTRSATLTTPSVSSSVVAGHARVDWSPVAGATQYQVDLIDFVQACGDFGFGYECVVTGYPSTTVVTTPFFQDPRSTFTRVLDPWESGLVRTHITVTARNPLAASFSHLSATSRFERVD